MNKAAGKTQNKMERQPYPPPGSRVAKNSQRPASVETVQRGVPPYGVKDTLVVKKIHVYLCEATELMQYRLTNANLLKIRQHTQWLSDSVSFICHGILWV